MSIVDGTYLARATGRVSWVQSPDKGTPCAALTFLIKEGPEAGKTVDYQGWITDNTSARVEEGLRLCGWDGDSDQSVTRQDVLIVVKNETNPRDGNSYPRVAWINDPNRGGSRFEALDSTAVASVKGKLRAAAVASKARNVRRDGDPDF